MASAAAKHTPGPWKVHLGFELDTGEIHPMRIFTDDGRGNGDQIPDRSDVDGWRLEEARANKALIESVHDLLAAAQYTLHCVLDQIIHESGHWQGVDLPIGGEQHGNFLTVVDASQRLACAIAKATAA